MLLARIGTLCYFSGKLNSYKLGPQSRQDLLDAAADEKTKTESGHAQGNEGDGQNAKPQAELFRPDADDQRRTGQGDEAAKELPNSESETERSQFLPGRFPETTAVHPQPEIESPENDPLDGQ